MSVTISYFDLFLCPVVPPIIETHPQDKTIGEGKSVTLSVQARGTNLHYQWQKDGANLPDEISDQFTVTTASPEDSGDYWCVVSNEGGSIASNHAHVTIGKT